MKSLTASTIMKEQITQMNKFFYGELLLFADYRKKGDKHDDLPA